MYHLTKKLFALCMIFLLISHGIIQFGLFEVFQAKTKADVAEMIYKGISSFNQVILGFHKNELVKSGIGIHWIDDHEFRYNGRMFDIINKEAKGDSVYLYCIEDSIESDLYSILYKFIEDDKEDPNEEDGLNNFCSHFYSLSEINILYLYPRTDNFHNEECIRNLLEGEYLLNTPPPRTCLNVIS